MITLLFSVLGFFGGAIVGWAIGVFVLQLHWETTILVAEIGAVAGAVICGVVAHRRKRLARQ